MICIYPRDLNLEHTIDELKSLESKLNNPSVDPELLTIVQTPSFSEAKIAIEQNQKQLISAREELKSLWQQAENRIIQASKLNKYKSKADRVRQMSES